MTSNEKIYQYADQENHEQLNSCSYDHDYSQSNANHQFLSNSLLHDDTEQLVGTPSRLRHTSFKALSINMSSTTNKSMNQQKTHSFARSRAVTILSSIAASIRKLKKSIGALKGFAVMVGIIIGSGIFISPNLVMAEVKDPGMAIMVWLISGLISLIGSLCYCELGTVISKAGGNYAYILHIYGPIPAFLCAWTQILLIDTIFVSVVSLTLGTYVFTPFSHIIEVCPWYPKAVASGIIIIIAVMNCISTKVATSCQTLFAAFQMLTVFFLAILGFWQLGIGHTDIIKTCFHNVDFNVDMLGNYGAAFFGSLWAYTGWQYVGNIVEDMIDVEKNLLLTVITSVPFVTLSYIAVNISLLTRLTPSQIINSNAPAITFVNALFGEKTGYIMPVLVAISCYGCVNGLFFSAGRVSLASGREGQFPEVLGMIHRRRQTPIPSIILLALISILLLLPDSSSIEFLVNFVSIGVWVSTTVAVSGIIVLRYKEPELKRQFKVWLIAPIFTVLVGIVLIVLQFIKDPIRSSVVIVVILLGLPVYYLFIFLKPKHPSCFTTFRQAVTGFIKRLFNLVPCQA